MSDEKNHPPADPQEAEPIDQVLDRVRETAKRNKIFLNDVIGALAHPFYVVDAETCRVGLANAAARRAGIEVGGKCYEALHGRETPCDGVDHPCPIQAIRRTGESAVFCHVHEDAEGNKRYVEIHGHPIFDENGRVTRILEYALDVTEQRQTTELLRQTTELTEKILEGLTPEEVLDHVYDSFRTVIPYDRIGFALIEEEGKVVRAVWARAEYEDIRLPKGYAAALEGSSLQEVLETGRPRILNDLEAYLAEHPGSGSTRRVVEEGIRSSLTCPLVALGKPVGFLFFSSLQAGAYENVHVDVFMKIAGHLSLIVEKSKLYLELVELNELKNQFLGIAAHDLRQPITVLQGYLNLMNEGVLGPVPGAQKTVIRKMQDSCSGMLALINDLLDVASIEAGRLEIEKRPVDLASFLIEGSESYRLLAKVKSITLQLDLEETLPPVSMDPDRILQVINNLVSNAVKYSHKGTKVILGARCAGREVEVYVSDEGQGIPGEELPNVFREFGKTSVLPTDGEKSTGLGLAIVRRIVTAHGGKVWVRSRVGEGSTFTFSLPIGDSD